VTAYVFRIKDRFVAIAWGEAGRSRKWKWTPTVLAYDIIGNSLPLNASVLGESPVYLVGKSVEVVLAPLAR
jgi:hypothetical protein